jgi:hypothetical protein
MFWLNSAELILVIGAIGGCISGVLTVYCTQQRLSRCSSIRCLWGCIDCKRDVESPEEIQMELDAIAESQSQRKPPEKNESIV